MSKEDGAVETINDAWGSFTEGEKWLEDRQRKEIRGEWTSCLI